MVGEHAPDRLVEHWLIVDDQDLTPHISHVVSLRGRSTVHEISLRPAWMARAVLLRGDMGLIDECVPRYLHRVRRADQRPRIRAIDQMWRYGRSEASRSIRSMS